MKAAARILLIVTATVINAEFFRTFEEQQVDIHDYDVTRCFEGINRCMPNIMDYSYFRYLDGNFDAIVPFIDQLCNDYRVGKSCLDGVYANCLSQVEYFGNIDWSMYFFCSDRGRSLLREFEQSVCYNDFPNVLQYVSDCRSYYGQYTSEMKLVKCLVRRFRGECGEAVGEIFTDMYMAVPETSAEIANQPRTCTRLPGETCVIVVPHWLCNY